MKNDRVRKALKTAAVLVVAGTLCIVSLTGCGKTKDAGKTTNTAPAAATVQKP